MSNADSGLSVLNYRPLNESFYSAKPHIYFVRRLQLLMLHAGRPEDIDDLLRAETKYDRVTMKVDDSDTDPEALAKEQQEYLTIEAEVLYHHAIETVLRLYLAHEGRPECPWLEMSRLRNPQGFKEAVQRRFLSEELQWIDKWERLGPVLVGLPPDDYPYGSDHLANVLQSLEDTMEVFASDFIGGAARYNAAKHGLAIQAAEQGLSLKKGGIPEADLAEAEAFLSAHGPAVTYLELRGDPRRWHEVTAFVDIDSRLVSIQIAAYLMEVIWGIGKARLLGPDGSVQLYLMDKSIDELVSRNRRWSLEGHAWSLLYENPDGSIVDRTGELLARVYNVAPQDESSPEEEE